MNQITPEFVKRMPKTELHCHLDGSLRIETVIELAQKNKVPLRSYEPATLMEEMGYGRVHPKLETYLLGFEPLVAVLQRPEDIERAFFEVCEDAALENVWHIELRYCPYLHTRLGMTSEEVVQATIRGAERAKKEFGMSVGHILCGLKHNEHASIFNMAKLAAQYRSAGVCAFDLAGPEAGFPIRDHLEAISLAKKNHLFITLHAGEGFGPPSIAQAVHEAGANRIGHGTSLLKDPELLDYVVNHRIGVEACPISNWQTGAVPSLADHPIKRFLEAGVRVSVNTDNRLCSNTSITKEILALVECLDLSLDDIRKILLNGFKSAFLPYDQRAGLLARFNAEWQRLMAETVF